LCMLFLDDPDWIREMIGFWQEYVAGLLEDVSWPHYVEYVRLLAQVTGWL